MDHEVDSWIGAASAVMHTEEGAQLEGKAFLFFYLSIYIPTLTDDHGPKEWDLSGQKEFPSEGGPAQP